jgi:hypothetical protein
MEKDFIDDKKGSPGSKYLFAGAKFKLPTGVIHSKGSEISIDLFLIGI